MTTELLAIVEVDRDERVICQAPGCGHAVYKRIHVVRHDGKLGVYGSDCFGRLFGDLGQGAAPSYGGGVGRLLTAEERLMLVQNTERLIAQFDAERQQAVERAHLQEQKLQQRQQVTWQRQRVSQTHVAPQRQPGPTQAELASVEAEAKRMVRAKYDVDPDAPGWHGLVMACQRELLGR